MNDKLKNLIVRTLSGAVMLALLLGATLGSYATFLLLLLAILLAGMVEFYRLARLDGARPQRWLGLTMGILIFVFAIVFFSGMADPGNSLYFLPFILCIPFLMLIVELFSTGGDLLKNVGSSLLGVGYVALPISLLIGMPLLIANGEWEPWSLLWFIFIIWANDVFAYLFGITLGRHKMCPTISPKKSWEGFAGGILGALVAGYAASQLLEQDLVMWCGLALVAAPTGVLGDLVESQLKRKVGVKDSGNLIPGHGGLLDRFDALLVATPFAFLYLVIYQSVS
ncbi:MAG: phosphatidate cytidylyltransferase [Rikenellaceae bacterium]|nr:phosphatidate cytidylyltransferase [Rikenellaceae bacterium]